MLQAAIKCLCFQIYCNAAFKAILVLTRQQNGDRDVKHNETDKRKRQMS